MGGGMGLLWVKRKPGKPQRQDREASEAALEWSVPP